MSTETSEITEVVASANPTPEAASAPSVAVSNNHGSLASAPAINVSAASVDDDGPQPGNVAASAPHDELA